MFILKDDFSDYKSTPPHSSDSVKAVDGDFEIIGEGTVIKCYLMDGKEKKLTYTRAIHTPTLNANLISVSTFNKAGLTVTFRGGRGVIRKPDGTIVLTAWLMKGMYVVNELNHDLPGEQKISTALVSLSSPVLLEQ